MHTGTHTHTLFMCVMDPDTTFPQKLRLPSLGARDMPPLAFSVDVPQGPRQMGHCCPGLPPPWCGQLPTARLEERSPWEASVALLTTPVTSAVDSFTHARLSFPQETLGAGLPGIGARCAWGHAEGRSEHLLCQPHGTCLAAGATAAAGLHNPTKPR